jgi:hypothetical protein
MVAKLQPKATDSEKTPRPDTAPAMDLIQATPPTGGSSTNKKKIVVKTEPK